MLQAEFSLTQVLDIMSQLLSIPAETRTPVKMTYDLRRLRMQGLRAGSMRPADREMAWRQAGEAEASATYHTALWNAQASAMICCS